MTLVAVHLRKMPASNDHCTITLSHSNVLPCALSFNSLKNPDRILYSHI